MRKVTDEQLLAASFPYPSQEYKVSDMVELVREPWSLLSLQDVRAEMSDPEIVDSGVLHVGERAVRYAAVLPEAGVRDETSSIVLSLPYLNTWDDHHYIRAKVLQQIVAPTSTVIVLPNNSFGLDAYQLTESDRQRLSQGDIAPISELHMRFLEKSPQTLGDLILTGYSFGGRNVLGIAGVGSDTIGITHVNADETPSKQGRTTKELRKDFMRSGGMGDLRRAVQESEIPALSKAMSLGRMSLGLTLFGLKDMSRDSRITRAAMTGSAEGLVTQAIQQLGSKKIKIGSVEGSRLFDHDSLSEHTLSAVDNVQYRGDLFHGHPSGDNVILHALMARDGLAQNR